jgi:hypothetical protein
MKLVNIITQSQYVPTSIGGIENQSIEDYRAYGWREIPANPNPDDSSYSGPVTYVEGDGITAKAVYKDSFIPHIASASLFRTLLRRNFGPNAEVNREVTKDAVLGYFAMLTLNQTITAQQASDGVFLKELFTELADFNGGETWTLFEKYGGIIP